MPDLTPHSLAAAAGAATEAHGALVDADALPDALPEALPRAAMAAFVQTLAQWGNVRAAAAQAGMSRGHLYRLRRACPEFRVLWDAALVLARPQVEEVLADRAINGVQETVFYHGEEVATRTRFDARLLLAHLARLDRVEKGVGTWKAVADFDAGVARLLDPPPVYDWDDEDEEEGWDGEDGSVWDDEAPRAGDGGSAAVL